MIAIRIIIGCEESQTICSAFRAAGREAYSCDLVPTRGDHPEWHYQCDVLAVIPNEAHEDYSGWLYESNWDVGIFHPDCTYLANSGVCHLYNKDGSRNEERWRKMEEGARFFKRLLNAPIPRICVENPIPHKYALEIIGEKYTQIIQPWMFGHMEQKATCLWLKGLPKLYPTNNVKEAMMKLPPKERGRIWHMAPGPNRQRDRSVTFKGIAEAIATQFV